MFTKICSKCKREFPHTAEYFYRQKGDFKSECKLCSAVRRKNYYEKNKQKENEQNLEYYHKHRDFEIQRMRTRRIQNPELISFWRKTHYRKNYKNMLIMWNIRKAHKAKIRSDFTLEQWENCKNFFNNRCCYCSKDDVLEQDHFIAFSKGGAYAVENIVPACKSCNSSKGDNDFKDWYSFWIHYSLEREQKILQYIELNRMKIYADL